MPKLAEIFRLFGPGYLERFERRMVPSHRRALDDITDCRTEALGGHVYQCAQCEAKHYAYHSCRNRHCPQCGGKNAHKWLDRCRNRLLPVRYFHLVFTLPKELRELVRSHQKVLLGVLCQAAAAALMKLARDPRYVGGTPGILAVVHTWTRAMIYHPHVHLLATGGGVSPDGSRWLSARKGYLVPVDALSVIFRAKFMRLAREALPAVKFPRSVWNQKWVVYSKPGVAGAEKVLSYLARYVQRVAITDRRILSVEDGRVRFRYKDSRDNTWKIMTLTGMEFMRRFLQHVLPHGFHKVRHYGLLAPSNRRLLAKAKELLRDSGVKKERSPGDGSGAAPVPEVQLNFCPACKTGILFLVATLPRRQRGPP
jgi:hypothetical protein